MSILCATIRAIAAENSAKRKGKAMKRIGSIVLVLVVLAQAGHGQIGPGEFRGRPQLTSHAALKAELQRLAKQSQVMRLEEIGKSVLGRELFLAKFSLHHPIPERGRKRPLVFVYAQQHGNEPSGKEAALLLCREFAGGKHNDLLRRLDVLIVPQVNPDGSEKGVRRNANNADLNRSHILLDQPETAALHRVFRRYLPEVTVDVHEYNDYQRGRVWSGYVRAYDEMLGALTNPNFSALLKKFAVDTVMREVQQWVKGEGFTFHRYLVGGPAEMRRYRYSTTAINDGRNSMGAYHAISFIIEGRRYGDLTTRLARRRASQRAAILGVLRSVARHPDRILQLVPQERQKLLAGNADLPVIAPRSFYRHIGGVELPLRIELLRTGTVVDTLFKNFTPQLDVPFLLERPLGYLVPLRLTAWLEVLQRHGVKITADFPAGKCLVQEYQISGLGLYESEEKQYLDVQVQRRYRLMTPSGKEFVFVPLNQLANQYIALILEPQSQNGLVQYPAFREVLRLGEAYPILRVLKWQP